MHGCVAGLNEKSALVSLLRAQVNTHALPAAPGASLQKQPAPRFPLAATVLRRIRFPPVSQEPISPFLH